MDKQAEPHRHTAKIVGKYRDNYEHAPHWPLDSVMPTVAHVRGYFLSLSDGHQQPVSKEEYDAHQVGDEYSYEENRLDLEGCAPWLFALILMLVVAIVLVLVLLPPR